MTGNVKISIALCTYNGEQFLRGQLDSILNQTFRDWELIVVDDVSTDGTWNILRAYADVDARFKLFRNETNLGHNRNFEKALSLCTGQYIAFCDQDDVWHADKLQCQLEAIGSNTLVYHDSEFIDENGYPMNLRISDKFNFYRGSAPEVFLYLNCVSGHSILMKRELVALALPFPDGFHYDQWLAFVATGTGSIDFVDRALVNYRQHAGNATDMLARRKLVRSKEWKISELEKESKWLRKCAEKAAGNVRDLLLRLATLSEARNRSFASPAYGMAIWRQRKTLLSLLKKSPVSKFFYTVRKIWGTKSKKLL